MSDKAIITCSITGVLTDPAITKLLAADAAK